MTTIHTLSSNETGYSMVITKGKESNEINIGKDLYRALKLLGVEDYTPEVLTEGRFKMPSDEQVLDMAIVFNEGLIEREKLADMTALCVFVCLRLHENGDITIPTKQEESDVEDDDEDEEDNNGVAFSNN
jgi:hypothetical protein